MQARSLPVPWRHARLFSVFLVLACSVASQAQNAPAPPAAADQQAKIRELEDRIIALENMVRDLKAAQQGQAAAPAPATQAAAATTTPPTQPAQGVSAEAPPAPASAPAGAEQGGNVSLGGAASMAKALNPDISVIGDFIGAAGNQFRPTPLFGESGVEPIPALQMHESELGLQAIIDPYARGDFFISFGEQGVNLEEGYITFTALPAGIVARVGKMRAAFGKVNTLHNHVLPWVDRPLVTENLVGGEDGINDAGFSVTRSFAGPKQLFLEGTAQVFRGDSDDIFRSAQRRDVSVVGHFRGYKDITESTNLDVGVSYSRGNNDVGLLAVNHLSPVPAEDAFVTNLYGVDATLRWKPLRRAIYHSFVGRAEFIRSDRGGFPTSSSLASFLKTERAFGFYTSGDYQFARRWFIGGRFDQSDRARAANLTDHGGSLTLTYWPTEFSQIRTQYRVTRYAEKFDAHELLFQVQFSLGAHGAHPF